MTTLRSERIEDGIVLAARILLVTLFLIFGSMKLADYSGTVNYMAQTGAPVPPVATLVAILVETFLSTAIVLGAWTRPLAVLLAVYTLVTGLIGHHYWTMTGTAQYAAEINFYKNISIAGGLLLLFVTGAGKYSVDAKLRVKAGTNPSGQPRSA